MFGYIEEQLLLLANSVPLEAFVFIGSFVEEVIAPVPSLAVMLMSGTLAALQDRPVIDLLSLAVIAAIGKSLGAIIVYFFAEKISFLVLKNFSWLVKITPEEVQQLGSKITGDYRDYFVLTLLRALPILPSSIVSVSCGVLKIPFRLFMVSTLIGTIVRDGIFLYVGYSGTAILREFATKSTDVESYLQIAILAVIVCIIGYIYLKRRRGSNRVDAS